MYGRAATPSLSCRACRAAAHCLALRQARHRARADRVQCRSWARAARCARCSCRTSSAGHHYPCASMPAPTITVFASRKAWHLTERAVNGMVKRTARKAVISEAVSPHWLRHAHGSHAIDRGASARGAVDAGPRQHRHHVRVTCTPGPTRRAAYTLIRECFFDEETGKGKRLRR